MINSVSAESIFLRALGVALLIGTILNLINQGDAIWDGRDVNFTKIFLTYLFPFLVSVHGAYAARVKAADSASLRKSGGEPA